LNFLPHEQETEIIATASRKHRQVYSNVAGWMEEKLKLV
jgi:hypothetical protein